MSTLISWLISAISSILTTYGGFVSFYTPNGWVTLASALTVSICLILILGFIRKL